MYSLIRWSVAERRVVNTWVVMSLRVLLLLLLLAVSSYSSTTQSGQTYASVLYSNRWMRTFLRLGMIAPGAIFANLPRTSRHRRQGTVIGDHDPNKGRQ